MLALVFLSFLQVLFLPGLLISCGLKKISCFDRILLSVPLSLTINYFAVASLYAIGVYVATAFGIIIGFECLLFTYILYKRGNFKNCSDNPKLKISVVALVPFFIFFILYKPSFFTVFTHWDAVVSWNRWAVELLEGHFNGSRNYPLGIPALYSILYTIAGSENLQTFAKMIPAFWILIGIFTFIKTSFLWHKYKSELLLACSLWLLLMRNSGMGSSIIFSGYVDSFMAVYGVFFVYFFAHLQQMNISNNTDFKRIQIFLIALASAALVKFTGIFLFFSFLLILFHFFGFKNVITKCWVSIVLSITLVFHWYLFSTLYYSDWHQQADAYGIELDHSYYLRVIHAAANFLKVLSAPLFLAFTYALYRFSQLRLLTVVLILPVFCFWALFVSYDLRSMFVVFPLVAFITSIGILKILSNLVSTIKFSFESKSIINIISFFKYEISLNIKFITISLFLLLTIATYTALNNDTRIENWIYSENTKQRLKANDFGANQKIYELLKSAPKAKILSCWQMIYGLPNSSQKVLPMGDCSLTIVNRWLSDKSIKYFLYWEVSDPNVPSLSEVRTHILSNENNVDEELLVPGYILFSRKN